MDDDKVLTVLMDLTMAISSVGDVVSGLIDDRDARLYDLQHFIEQATHSIEQLRDERRSTKG